MLRRYAPIVMTTLTLTGVGAVPTFAQTPQHPMASGAQEAQTEVQADETAVTGGTEFGTVSPTSFPTVPGRTAKILPDGRAAAPADAPDAVKRVIWAGNGIIGLPYRYGGGHGSFVDTGYDCSGTVSYALGGAELVRRPRSSSGYFSFGQPGRGRWMTVYTNPGHMYLVVAGIRLDTSAADHRGGGKGPRWRPLRTSNRGYRARRPAGL